MKHLLTWTLLFTSTMTFAQELYQPRQIKQAYDKQTRSPDGKPGKNYWQNTAKYDIALTVTPPDRRVKGTETITYTNNSPDTLKTIVIRLLLNSHTAQAVRQWPVSSAYLTSGVHIDRYAENKVVQPWEEGGKDKITFRQIKLASPLAPKASVQLSFDWHYDLSVESDREGAIDSTTYFLAYFYPRVGVYDDYNGWDVTHFPESIEFYNDFGDYHLEVTVPKNYIVWSTGDLQNTEEVLQPVYAKRLKQSMTSDAIIKIADAKEVAAKNITHQQTNTWKWKATNVSDLALAISNTYVWDASSVIVDDASKRRVSVQSAYADTSADFHQMVGFGRHALDWFSHHWPGVAYPYSKTTVVQGFADMEYPMMVNDNTQSDADFARFVVEHEIAHTWFPFYMGINETRYGFMDEGWATALEYLIGTADMGKTKEDSLFKMFRVNRWAKSSIAESDLPIITPTSSMTGPALRNNEYGKAALGYLAVKQLLGDEGFKKGLHTFMERWNGKHPTPWDMFYSFNDGSGKNLNWFWNNWYFSNNYIDLTLTSVEANSSKSIVRIKNTGGFAIPFTIEVTYPDGSKQQFHNTPIVWETNQKEISLPLPTKAAPVDVVITSGIYVDANEGDNGWNGRSK
ncbi:MAG: aminopeptidase [Chitinophagaceae bacterium]|nr:aminopeptidase [Chitinophagaceae bacterium]